MNSLENQNINNMNNNKDSANSVKSSPEKHDKYFIKKHPFVVKNNDNDFYNRKKNIGYEIKGFDINQRRDTLLKNNSEGNSDDNNSTSLFKQKNNKQIIQGRRTSKFKNFVSLKDLLKGDLNKSNNVNNPNNTNNISNEYIKGNQDTRYIGGATKYNSTFKNSFFSNKEYTKNRNNSTGYKTHSKMENTQSKMYNTYSKLENTQNTSSDGFKTLRMNKTSGSNLFNDIKAQNQV